MQILFDSPGENVTFEELYRLYTKIKGFESNPIPSYYDGYRIGYNTGYDAGVKAEQDRRNNTVDSMGNAAR